MKSYLVGGWVRDYLRQQPSQDRDWVVVGATPLEMIEKGFKSIGASFPVFLHPKTQEEYALARTEKKVSKGYHGFSVYSEPSVTLEEDLSRRDLTINAMAFDPITEEIYDPFEGQKDWNQGWLRHVSPAFSDDPLRLVRLARFYAVFDHMKIHPQTLQLCKDIVANNEIQSLIPERVRLEVQKLYKTACKPHRFWQALDSLGALEILFPELHGLDFTENNILCTQDKEEPFLAGLLQLRLLLINPDDFGLVAQKLRCSRSELSFLETEKILSKTERAPSSIVNLILKTRALHDHSSLQIIHNWALREYIPWEVIDCSLKAMKSARLPDLALIEPSMRNKTLVASYSDQIERMLKL